MELLKFEDAKGEYVFINPDSVAYVKKYGSEHSLIYFVTSDSEGQKKVSVKGKAVDIARKLSGKATKELY